MVTLDLQFDFLGQFGQEPLAFCSSPGPTFLTSTLVNVAVLETGLTDGVGGSKLLLLPSTRIIRAECNLLLGLCYSSLSKVGPQSTFVRILVDIRIMP
jgi:hypothetical protein